MKDNYEKDSVIHAEAFLYISFIWKVERFEDILEKVSKMSRF